MSKQVSSIRGMSDVLPEDTPLWQYIEGVLKTVVQSYGYHELRVPVVERTELFKRSIGEVTDIVEKEMYTFSDRNDESLTLRPEGTAGIVRAGIGNGLLYNQKQKLWLTGPMFRYEKPQKGRYRQFYQFDVEAFGYEGPDIDAELIMISARVWKLLGLDALELQLNSLGTPESRVTYRAELIEYFSAHKDELDDESQARLLRNPMRLLDSKHPKMQALIEAAPRITDHLDNESAEHFAGLQELLGGAGIKFKVNSRLVRGLDYYSRTVFEWVTDKLGAQGAVCSGGRYDGLVEHLGGKATPAIGWAVGLERLIELYRVTNGAGPVTAPDAYLVAVGDAAAAQALLFAEMLRNEVPGMIVEVNCGGGSYKAQFKRADKSGARVALILGEQEVESRQVGIKALRQDAEQFTVAWEKAAAAITSTE
ncbi:MAG: histidine--tRNA ligase [Gammaproteobacteria bacterium]|nr:histidine--tRNA ligase [Gammaproteobacteria bacterium]MCP4088937.1 histidine--tRNA ligase [Gammaproteobacteria bacterium]MCP4274953.1 histidine--tRNA ligase [Gammaproteobacteria bacterium]MCP4831980.1 histidine--tRNA ligase [Gammaproteobacteria bacterium]MCP4929415.1 histidine--tRNA ligase [Gammaproteobacteria bacterium]